METQEEDYDIPPELETVIGEPQKDFLTKGLHLLFFFLLVLLGLRSNSAFDLHRTSAVGTERYREHCPLVCSQGVSLCYRVTWHGWTVDTSHVKERERKRKSERKKERERETDQTHTIIIPFFPETLQHWKSDWQTSQGVSRWRCWFSAGLFQVTAGHSGPGWAFLFFLISLYRIGFCAGF